MPGDERSTDSGIEVRPLYDASSLDGFDPATSLGRPGEAPYTRGIHPAMHRDRLWTMRQYAGFGTARDTNERFKFLLAAGQTGRLKQVEVEGLDSAALTAAFGPQPGA